MSKKLEIKDESVDTSTMAPVPAEIYMVGLKKLERNRYALVTGTTEKYEVRKVAEPLEITAQEALVAFRALIATIP